VSAYDEIAAGLVDSQIESIELDDGCLWFRLPEEPRHVRGVWQARVVTGVAADQEPDAFSYWGVRVILADGSERVQSRSIVTLHDRGPLPVDEALLEHELSRHAQIENLVFHRPSGRVAVEAYLRVDDPGWRWLPEEHVGEGAYLELRDRDGRLVREWGYSRRCRGGVGRWGPEYAHLGRGGLIDG
jgi:hypothetical protein